MNIMKKLLFTALTWSLTTAASALELEVFAAGPAGFHATSTLIKGEKSAILVDAQFTLSEAHRLAAQILESGKTLKTVVITHAHPDHYFGLEVILQQFPNATVVAAPEVAEQMKLLGPQKLAQWKPLYGNNLTSTPLSAAPLAQTFLELDGERIELLDLLPGEIEHSTALYIPSLKAVIAGDLAYNGVHVWLAETNATRRGNWLTNLKRIAALNPKIVVAGHKVPGRADTAAVLTETAAYIDAFVSALTVSKNPEELVAKVKEKVGSQALPIILEIAAKAVFTEGPHSH